MKRKYILVILVMICLLLAGGVLVYINSNHTSENTGEDYVFNSAEQVKENVEERSYAVSSSSDIATDVGMSVLEAGGNAVDAAIAMSYVLGVVEPYASGLGGSGGMLVYDRNTEKCTFYDYRACAGSATTPSDQVSVPGLVAGMESVHQDYGSLSMSDLIEPALHYAEQGFTVNDILAYRFEADHPDISGYSSFYDENGKYLKVGDKMYNQELASTLQSIQEQGSDVFYHGYIAEDIAQNTSLTTEDLASYSVLKSDAVQGYFNDYTIYSAGMPLSGITLIQMLEMAEEMNLADPEQDLSSYLLQLETLSNAAYSDRYSHISDPSYYDIDQQSLVSREYIQYLLGQDGNTLVEEDPESTETTSFSVADSDGLIVSVTNTISTLWGSKIAVDGIILNNTTSNFSNSGVNAYEPGKRSRTFTAPTIILGTDGYIFAIGTPGGNNIPCRLFQVITDILEFGTSPQEAVTKTGVLYRNDTLYVELDQEGHTWLDMPLVTDNIVYRDTGYWWGSISLAGLTEQDEAFGAYDYRRGATKAGICNKD